MVYAAGLSPVNAPGSNPGSPTIIIANSPWPDGVIGRHAELRLLCESVWVRIPLRPPLISAFNAGESEVYHETAKTTQRKGAILNP